MKQIIFIITCLISLSSFSQDSLYKEKYRPQYHFTPKHRWIGDPCGLVKHNGKYISYSWGAATSDDLIHWTELNDHAIKNVPTGISTFTGSVVVDTINSANYGEDAYIAIFTSFDEQSKKQSQSIAFSHDNGESYQYYDQNPVLDIWSTEFRDPTVIRDSSNNQWVMAVAKALEKKIAFYGSKDLKHWKWLSDFGPLGDSDKSWECPDIFQLPVNGDLNNKKWVIVVSVNWAREQYFIGEFNGTEFIPDNPQDYPLYIDHGLDYYASRVFQNYDNPDAPIYTLGWLNTWDYANEAPTTYGKGIWSLPREYRLIHSNEGLRLIQTPYDGLKVLREKEGKVFKKNLNTGITPLPFISSMNNSYEMDIEFTFNNGGQFGLYLCQGDGRKVTLSYDSESGNLILDRTHVSDSKIPKFDRISSCNVPPRDNKIRFNIFVDKSTIEIFVNNGEKTLSALTYPDDNQSGASIFSLSKNIKADLLVWKINPIWKQ